MAVNGIGCQINIMAKVTDLTPTILALTSMLMAMTLLSVTLTSNIDIEPYNVNGREWHWLAINIMAKVTVFTLTIFALTSMLMAMTLLSLTLTNNINIAPYNVND